MPRKRVFLLMGAALSVYRQQAGSLVRTHAFQNNRAGLQEFVNYLEEDPETPVCFLLDIVEEEFQLETIPHVFGSDRRALVKNRQRRLFRDTPYRYTVFQDREIHGRRDDNVLFAAVARPATLQCWLDPVARCKIPLVGIYSLPILSKKLLPYIDIGKTKTPRDAARKQGLSDYVLLVHCNAIGLRQSFFYRQHLKVSRLAAALRPDDGAFSSFPEEVENIRHYLDTLRLLPPDQPLDVYLLGNAKTSMRLEPQTTGLPNTRYHLVDLAEIGAKIGVADDPTASSADAIFAGILLRSTPANHYAPPSDTRHFRSARIRMATYALGLALLIITIILGAFQLSELLIIRQKTDILAKRARIHEDRYARRATDSPAFPIDGPTLKAVVETAMTLQESRTTPYPALFALSEVLGKRNLEIEEIQWSVSADSSLGAHATPEARARPGSTPSKPSPMEAIVNTYQIALIKGRIVAFSDYRSALLSVEDFASALSRVDAVEDVRIIERPLNISSEETITGKADAALAPGSANFVLKAVFRNKPPKMIEHASP